MKNIYKITKGQLISIWIFGLIGWIYAIDSYSDFSSFLSVFIPAVIVFYTIGWKNFNKKEITENPESSFKIKDIRLLLKKLIKPLFVILLIAGVVFGFNRFSEIKKDKIRIEKLTQDYNQAIKKVGSLQEQVRSCYEPARERKYQEELRSCNLLKNKVKADYDFCFTYTSVSPRASCLYDYDYEKIDCSEETVRNKSEPKITKADAPESCVILLNELIDVNHVIEEYSKVNKY